MDASLTPREKQCLAGVFAGKSNKEIALELCTSDQTVKNSLRFAYEKLGIHNGVRGLFPLVIAAKRELVEGIPIQC